jgi:hypothetical protein
MYKSRNTDGINNTADSRYTRGVAFLRIAGYIENNRHFDVKRAPQFFDAKLIICATFPDKPGEGSAIGFKIWPLLVTLK